MGKNGKEIKMASELIEEYKLGDGGAGDLIIERIKHKFVKGVLISHPGEDSPVICVRLQKFNTPIWIPVDNIFKWEDYILTQNVEIKILVKEWDHVIKNSTQRELDPVSSPSSKINFNELDVEEMFMNVESEEALRICGAMNEYDVPKGYESLTKELLSALDQASKGKGKERHATDEPFNEQQIIVINRWLKDSPVAGPVFQAVKKAIESSRMEPHAAMRELDGAIVYLCAAKILLREYGGDNQVKEIRTGNKCDHVDLKTEPSNEICTHPSGGKYCTLNRCPLGKGYTWI